MRTREIEYIKFGYAQKDEGTEKISWCDSLNQTLKTISTFPKSSQANLHIFSYVKKEYEKYAKTDWVSMLLFNYHSESPILYERHSKEIIMRYNQFEPLMTKIEEIKKKELKDEELEKSIDAEINTFAIQIMKELNPNHKDETDEYKTSSSMSTSSCKQS